jgi:hypothetical protein
MHRKVNEKKLGALVRTALQNPCIARERGQSPISDYVCKQAFYSPKN